MPYKTLTDEELIDFPINDFAAEESDLFIWATHKKLPTALTLLEKWRFKYHALLVWDKEGGVCLNGFYRNTELVAYGYRGRMGIDIEEGHYIPTLFKEKATNHSKKPSKFYELLRKRTQEPRVDIFARMKHPGFDAWGDEVEENQITLESII